MVRDFDISANAIETVNGLTDLESLVGRLAHPEAAEQKLADTPVWAPSVISARGAKFCTIEGQPGYTTFQIPEPSSLAINAKKAGFHGVECLEVLKELVSVFGRNVGLKLSPAGCYNDVGMPLEDTIETYSHFITKADKLGIAYVILVRHSPNSDFEVDGKSRATHHDVFGTFRPFIKNAKAIVNADVTPEEGERLVSEGKVDAVAFGFNFITHPDLVKRIKAGYPLDNTPEIPHLQTKTDSGDF
ncbi:hypothetical protein CVT24_005556 [Panaeolus cyanescens]|uniref:Uncharacterized protein n=1 Tax=Panaeolus cyanescens TaxID=181874 RepID=A0A409WVT5_9AGAR|nr:hypothetical protein CVT24_005556 [Panaeolus cyanescens]